MAETIPQTSEKNLKNHSLVCKLYVLKNKAATPQTIGSSRFK